MEVGLLLLDAALVLLFAADDGLGVMVRVRTVDDRNVVGTRPDARPTLEKTDVERVTMGDGDGAAELDAGAEDAA